MARMDFGIYRKYKNVCCDWKLFTIVVSVIIFTCTALSLITCTISYLDDDDDDSYYVDDMDDFGDYCVCVSVRFIGSLALLFAITIICIALVFWFICTYALCNSIFTLSDQYDIDDLYDNDESGNINGSINI